jgi:hypothetical protein
MVRLSEGRLGQHADVGNRSEIAAPLEHDNCAWIRFVCDSFPSTHFEKSRLAWYLFRTWFLIPLVQFHPLTTPFSVVSGEFFALNTLHGITAYTASALSLTFLYLRNVSDLARLSTTITR